MKADTIIDMLMCASQQIFENLKTMKSGRRSATDADTLLRILCHKKDKVASNFLKIQYQLPKSSDYDDTFAKAPHGKSPLRRKSSFNWNKNGQRSFRILKMRDHFDCISHVVERIKVLELELKKSEHLEAILEDFITS
ncbi:hypothetical protein Cni_G19329 [Canna indica]|uniref:PATROL1-like C-terminal domain-containing protein n=1 Tax=Canna indica TaxID=4628 RepID=A0AAQ3KKV7_9LILI|nr:hypothetical protein Cni_G19329 [Canna indica]